MSDGHHASPADRRIARTRSAILRAFVQELSEKRWSDVTIAAIADQADLARSTFYQYFKGKEDLLLASMEPMLAILASAHANSERQRLEAVLAHFWSNRPLARAIFGSTRSHLIENAIRERILTAGGQGNAPCGEIAAVRMAASRTALIAAWVRGRITASVPVLAEALAESR